jgi:hypothetical protein
LLHNLLIVLQVKTKIPIILIVWIYFVH